MTKVGDRRFEAMVVRAGFQLVVSDEMIATQISRVRAVFLRCALVADRIYLVGNAAASCRQHQ